MKFFKELLSIFINTYTVLILIIALLMKFDVFGTVSFIDGVFTLMLMSLATSLVITIVDFIISENRLLNTLIGLIGCTVSAYTIGILKGYMEFNFINTIVMIAISITVYLIVWLLTIIQNKKDADDLNESLNKINNKIEQ